jgi:hypothetical protein
MLRAILDEALVCLKLNIKLLSFLTILFQFWGPKLATNSSVTLSWDIEPFLDSTWQHNNSDSAYPPASARRLAFKPTLINFSWDPKLTDSVYTDAAIESAARLLRVAVADGQDVKHGVVYPNYALPETPLEELYGENVPRLKALRKKHDPKRVMDFAGGFHF